jgi:hypothetical protein
MEISIDLPEINDIGLLDTQRDVETFRHEMDRFRGMSIDVVLAAVLQMLSSMANPLNIVDVVAVLAAIQRAL